MNVPSLSQPNSPQSGIQLRSLFQPSSSARRRTGERRRGTLVLAGSVAALATGVFCELARRRRVPPTNVYHHSADNAASRPPRNSGILPTSRERRSTTGFIPLYRTNEVLYAEIRPQLLNQPIIADGHRTGLPAGQLLNSATNGSWCFAALTTKSSLSAATFIIRPKGTRWTRPCSKTTDSVIMALPIVTINPMTQGALIDFGQIFLTDLRICGSACWTETARPGARSRLCE